MSKFYSFSNFSMNNTIMWFLLPEVNIFALSLGHTTSTIVPKETNVMQAYVCMCDIYIYIYTYVYIHMNVLHVVGRCCFDDCFWYELHRNTCCAQTTIIGCGARWVLYCCDAVSLFVFQIHHSCVACCVCWDECVHVMLCVRYIIERLPHLQSWSVCCMLFTMHSLWCGGADTHIDIDAYTYTQLQYSM